VKKRNWPEAQDTTSAVNSPVPSSSRTKAPPTGPAVHAAPVRTVCCLRSLPGGTCWGGSGAPHMTISLAQPNRYADQVNRTRSGTIVVFDAGQPQHFLQHEPGVAGTLADAALRDGRLALVQSGAGVDGPQLVARLDGAVFVGGHGPPHVHAVRMCPAALHRSAG
jgi:hypothetical protein